MSRQKFRLIIIIHWLLVVAYTIILFATENLLPSELRSYLDTQANTSITAYEIVFLIFGIVYFIFCVALSVGLFLFKRWAKNIILPSVVIGSLLILASGPCVETEWTSFFGYILNLFDGIIFALVYLSPVSRMFWINHSKTRVE